MKIESKLITDLRPATYNPRQISTKQYKDLKESIKKFGLVDPIIINQNGNVVVGGHQRLKICKELKHIEIDCVVLDLSKEEERELNIRLNKNTGTFDMDILANEFDIDELVDWGFKHIDLDINIDKITEGNTEDDYIPEVKESRVKLGDVWQLGKHRLMCGDSTKESDVNKLMNGDKAEVLFTSPPYSDMREYNGEKDLSIEHLIDFISSFTHYTNCQVINLGIQRKGGEISEYWNDYISKAKESGYKFTSWNIWDKSGLGASIGNQTAIFPIWHEWIFVFTKEKIELNRTKKNKSAGSKSGTNRQKDGTTKRFGKKKIKRFGKIGTVIKTGSANGKHHPAMFPVELPSEYIKAMTNKNEIVVDCFIGSGSTLIACEKTNRICYGMELDTKYCDVIIERWEQFTGQKATKCG